MTLLINKYVIFPSFFNSYTKIHINLLNNLIIGEENYSRITVPPMIWFGFKGLSSNKSYVLNISNELHDPKEVERKPLSFLKFLKPSI